ncbi:MAG: LAGLIDADG family homing endonuclease [Candidatus Omnitrophica bacterium]|nr:LAGLIDADG family homing endonuclease [Candidatus Omnitrophota bacterium]MDD5429217.1 LAGLIDADG family homing endonuclease [Candidatus Omnitrophota bacterium]
MEGDLKFSANAIVVLKKRYLRKNNEGKIVETPKELLTRVAENIARVESRYGASKDSIESLAKSFFEMMRDLEFMPNSPTLMNAGRDLGQLSACFVVPVEDSMDSIFDAIKSTALIHKTGGGTGFSFSRLRPKNSVVKSTGGVASGPVSFMKVFDAATQAVKQGGTRRGANMGILKVDHPDILEFIKCKEKEGDICNFNISVALTDDFMEKVLNKEKYDLIDPHSGQTVESLDACEVFDTIAQYAYKNGEPGIVFIDKINKDNSTRHLGDVESTNPCVTADTWVMTEDGPRKVIELLGKEFVAITDGKKYRSTFRGFFNTGVKPVYRLKTKEGFEVRLTLNHPLSKVTYQNRDRLAAEWVSADSLKSGDKVILHNHEALKAWEGDHSFDEGYLTGLLLGDGTLKKDKFVLSVWEKDKGVSLVKEEALRVAMSFPHRKDFKGWLEVEGRGECRLSSAHVKNIGYDLGLNNVKQITERMEKASSEFCRGLLRGLFDADGSVQGNQEKGVSIRLSQSDINFLNAVQRILLRLGIYSKIYAYRRREGKKSLPDGKGGFKEYSAKAQHELVISEENILRFAQLIGFKNREKNQKLTVALKSYKRKLNKEFFTATVEEVIFEGIEDVYDAQIPEVHAFDANGFKVHNCGEQPLLPYESCNLGSINLYKMLKNTGKGFEIDWTKLEKTTRFAARFLDNVIDANRFPLPKIKENTLRTRKIGLGIMGWATMLGFLGIPYDSDEAINLAREVMGFIRDVAKSESIVLAKERGVFPAWKGSRWQQEGVKIRNATLTTIAPTGTISLIAGPTASGIEPSFYLCYFRNVLDGEKLLEVDPAFEYVAKKKKFYSQELMKKIASGESIQTMEEVPDDVKRTFKTAMEVSPYWHIKMQGAFQEFTDNAVSKTINLPNDADVEDVKESYMLAYKLGCKGITVYRDGSRNVQVLTVDNKNSQLQTEGAQDGSLVIPYPKPRPEVILGTTTKVTTGCGNLYITVNQDEEGNLFEVFTQMGKAGGCAGSQLEAVGRLVSLALRGGIDIKVIVEQLKGIRCPSPSWDKGKKIFSCADAIARVLEKRGLDQKDIVEVGALPVKKIEEEKITTVVKKSNSHNVVGVCIECGFALRHQEGCLVCDACGYSKC